MPTKPGRGSFWVAAGLIIVAYSLPLALILWDLLRTDHFRGSPGPALWLGNFLSTDGASALLTSILLPFAAAAVTAVAVYRRAKWPAIATAVVLGISLSIALVLFVILGGSATALDNWAMHGLTTSAFNNLNSYARQSIESIILFLGMVTGVAMRKPTDTKPE